MTKKILIVDDSEDIRTSLSDLLEESDYEVCTARNAAEGIKLASEQMPDLILCDILMPGPDGYKCLEALKADPECAGIPLLFITARAEKSEIAKGLEAGASGYITKPYDSRELLKIIQTTLSKSPVDVL